jgi:hypothetical protein
MGADGMKLRSISRAAFLSVSLPLVLAASPDDPRPKPENTIHVELSPLVTPQTFGRPLHFYVAAVVDRSGSPQPLLLLRERGGIFVDRAPTEIVREGIVASLEAANLSAGEEAHADIVLRPYLFHFGLESGSGEDLFGKVELAVTVKDAKSGDSKEITAAGTSIAGLAVRKKNIEKNMKGDMEAALQDAITNLLRGTQLRDAVNSFAEGASSLTVRETSRSVGTADQTFAWNIATTEPKHFARAEGVELSPEFTDYLYAEVRNELAKSKKYGRVVSEGEAVSPTGPGEAVVVDGILTEYKKGSRVKDGLIGFGAGARSLRMTVTLERRDSAKSVVRIELRVRTSPRWTEQVMAREAAKAIAADLHRQWEKEKKNS